jgi:hypothetical protein
LWYLQFDSKFENGLLVKMIIYVLLTVIKCHAALECPFLILISLSAGLGLTSVVLSSISLILGSIFFNKLHTCDNITLHEGVQIREEWLAFVLFKEVIGCSCANWGSFASGTGAEAGLVLMYLIATGPTFP